MSKKLQIAVIGSAGQEEYPQNSQNFSFNESLAFEVGQILAEKGCILVNGGKSGIMEASSKGAKSKNGITIGVIKGNQRFGSNQYTDIEIVSNILDGGDALLIPTMCDGAIVIGGGAGTLAELSGFYRINKPIITIANTGGWAQKLANTYLDERQKVLIQQSKNPVDAVNLLLA